MHHFGANDIRLAADRANTDLAHQIGAAVARYLGAKNVVLGRDRTGSSKIVAYAVAKGMCHAGSNAMDTQMDSMELMRFAISYVEADGGLQVTYYADSGGYCRMQILDRNARAIDAESGLEAIRNIIEAGEGEAASKQGLHAPVNVVDPYVERLSEFIEFDRLQPLRLVVNSGDDCTAILWQRLERKLPFDIVRVDAEPQQIGRAVVEHGADMGMSRNSETDRCTLFDEKGAAMAYDDADRLSAELLAHKKLADKTAEGLSIDRGGMLPLLLIIERVAAGGESLSQLAQTFQ